MCIYVPVCFVPILMIPQVRTDVEQDMDQYGVMLSRDVLSSCMPGSQHEPVVAEGRVTCCVVGPLC